MWNAYGETLSRGDIQALPADVADELRHWADDPRVIQAATRLGLPPLLLVIGILARRSASPNRYAERVATRIFKGLADEEIRTAIDDLTAGRFVA